MLRRQAGARQMNTKELAGAVTRRFPLPTGYLFTGTYERGELETLSIGDYGKAHNIKADFLGYTEELHGVPNMPTAPLSEKWVITLSTQYGCPQKCKFCDVPNIPFRGNASFDDLKAQFYNAIRMFPSVHYTDRLNVHFARMGEPILNKHVFEFAHWLIENKVAIFNDTGLRLEVIHPVLTTSLPRRFVGLEQRLQDWCFLKNERYNGQAGLQISVNSTDEAQRQAMFGGETLPLDEFAEIARDLPDPIGRKYCLNFAFATGSTVDGNRLADLFSPDKFMCKITPIHNNNSCAKSGIKTVGGYDSYAPYHEPEASLKAAGFDVLVFVPSMDEERGLVTCGNLVLGGGKVTSEDVIRIRGVTV